MNFVSFISSFVKWLYLTFIRSLHQSFYRSHVRTCEGSFAPYNVRWFVISAKRRNGRSDVHAFQHSNVPTSSCSHVPSFQLTIVSTFARLTVQRNDYSANQPKFQSLMHRYALQIRAWRANSEVSQYQLDINLTFEVQGNNDLCNCKVNRTATDVSVKTDIWLFQAVNPSARRITYARRSIARYVSGYSECFR